MFRPACYCLLLAMAPVCLAAQQHEDSLRYRLTLLTELVQAGNYEEAQLEADMFRNYLQRNQVLCPAAAVPTLSHIYFHNKDKKSAFAFFEDASDDARHDPDPGTQALLLQALVEAFDDWGEYKAALAIQELLIQVRDTLATQRHMALQEVLTRRIDSLAQIRLEAEQGQAKYLQINRNLLAYLSIGLGMLILSLILLNWRNAVRWRKRLDRKILENDFLRSERFTSTFAAEPALVPVPEDSPQAFEPLETHSSEHHRPEKTALLIEPNRQVVLYLKSLLTDRFEVETASTPTEGLQLASNHLPDLIVCDAVLNGQTGIDVVRQIKLAERTNHIPVILLTDKPGNDGKLDALRAGADAWFSRPVLHQVFDSQITRLLDAQKIQQEAFARFMHLYFSENRTALSDPFLTKAIQIVDQNLSDPDFLADDLARKMQLHKQHFVKKLIVLTGKEPAQLIREMRLEKAKALLEKRAGTPQAIAELVGFASTGSFALAFKEYFGENTALLRMPDR
ncbi:MAG: response regulator transcription factor [Lewinellaceae bacterium]|nr:response regulator transcription factor [Saprospiraceae bacterium]MCB9330706.1 response regulator transcription factor [Lewinellaceae bacterium]